MTLRVLKWLTDQLLVSKKVAMATVLSTSGSVPGKTGSRLALTTDTIIGTIGGAGLERIVIERLQKMLSEATTAVGEVQTYGLNKGAKGYEVIPLDSLCGGRVTLALEVIIAMPHILFMGGGHCAKAISIGLQPLGWSFSVHDTRLEYSTLEGAAESHHCSVMEFFESEKSLNRFSDILLLGHDWQEDEERLLTLLNSDFSGRIGVIGSRAKWQAFEQKALDTGISQKALDAVNCPIGLNIGAESPEEIAIAVIAEIIAACKGVNPDGSTWRDQS